MSAYQLPDTHIGAIARFLIDTQRGQRVRVYWAHTSPLGGSMQSKEYDFRMLCDVLAAECYRSVRSRYPSGPLPGPISAGDGPVVVDQPMSRYAVLRPVDALKACSSYAYQSCETDDWGTTKAHAIIEHVESAAIRLLPDFKSSPAWTVEYMAGDERQILADAKREHDAAEANRCAYINSQN